MIPATHSLAISAHTTQHEFIQLFSSKTGLERNRQIARGRQCHLRDKAILEWPCLLVYSCLDLHTLLTSQILELQLVSDIHLSIGPGIGFREY